MTRWIGTRTGIYPSLPGNTIVSLPSTSHHSQKPDILTVHLVKRCTHIKGVPGDMGDEPAKFLDGKDT